ncbi:CAP domain-containing protein [Oceanobacillus bengalensis]|nr:CAP domain-containing protein [Oceanobacillus bengalensis]
MKKIFSVLVLSLMFVFPLNAHAQIKMFNEPPFDYYKVSKGDSFWFIAKRYGLDYQELMRLNPSVVPTNMQVGSAIRLRDTAKSPASFEQQVADLVNAERAKVGLGPLKHRADIKNVAEKKAMDLINSNYFAHNSPNYGSPFDMLKTFGIAYRTAGENIAKGQKSPQEVMNAWMNSPGHKANILKAEYDSIGVGYYQGAWVQLFTGS